MSAVPENLQQAIAQVPAGRWGLAISGGSDSVALLHLARGRPDLLLHAVHLDHETRQGESTVDAGFVGELCKRLSVPLTSVRRSEIEPGVRDLPANTQARYRVLRLTLYARVIAEKQLEGILQAHHADDQAETILMRLIRGTGIDGLCGIAADGVVDGIRIVRPLLEVRKEDLRQFLAARQLRWREDLSNASPSYRRNQVRQVLGRHPLLTPALLRVQGQFTRLWQELEQLSGPADERITGAQLLRRHPIVQLHLLRKWAVARGASAEDLTMGLLERLREMLEDMALGPSVCLPGGIEVRRRAGGLFTKGSARPAPTRDAAEPPDPS